MRSQTTLIIFLFSTLLLITSSCKKGGSSSDISGSSSKIWKVAKLTDADGDKEKLDKEEKSDQMQFYADGTFTANSADSHSRGTWKHDQGSNTLTLQFENANVTQNYEVVELSDDKMRLKAGDNSEMVMETLD